MENWEMKQGIDQDVIWESNVEIRRNLRGYEFPNKMDKESANKAMEDVSRVCQNYGFTFYDAVTLSRERRMELAFKNLIPLIMVKEMYKDQAVLLNDDEDVAILVNFEDHVTIKSIVRGSDMHIALKNALDVAKIIERNLDVAYSERMGYITADPLKCGLAMRLEYVAFIPATEIGLNVNSLSNRLSQFDWTVAKDNKFDRKNSTCYRIHSERTMGISEIELFNTAVRVGNNVLMLERVCRKTLCEKKPEVVEDNYYRRYGLLRYARKLSSAEAFEALAWIRLAQDYITKDGAGEINLTWEMINRLTDYVYRFRMPTIKLEDRNNPKAVDMDKHRATWYRDVLEGDGN